MNPIVAGTMVAGIFGVVIAIINKPRIDQTTRAALILAGAAVIIALLMKMP